jgi:hypothetical protein
MKRAHGTYVKPRRDKVFDCPKCNVTFTRNDTLRTHLTRVHGEEPPRKPTVGTKRKSSSPEASTKQPTTQVPQKRRKIGHTSYILQDPKIFPEDLLPEEEPVRNIYKTFWDTIRTHTHRLVSISNSSGLHV